MMLCGSPAMLQEVTGLLTIVGQMVNLLTEQNVAKSLALLKPTDIYITPNLGDITAMDFARQLDAAALGREAANTVRAQLSRLTVPPDEYNSWRTAVNIPGSTNVIKVDTA